MSQELDQDTLNWLSSLKINKKFSKVSEFENGYNFGIIFDKLQLSKGRKFKNNSDLGCVFQNYKNVRDILLQSFDYQFPVNNIIYRTSQLLQAVKQQVIKYQQHKKLLTLKAASTLPPPTLLHPSQQKLFHKRQKQLSTSPSYTLPKKLQDIEKKLQKFREEKTRHQVLALKERQMEIEEYRKAVAVNREFQIMKLQQTHQSTKNLENRVVQFWNKTQQVKKNRILKDNEFKQFQQSKIQKLKQTKRLQQIQTVDRGLQMFVLNCARQGVQLDIDPDMPKKPQNQINPTVVMQRIKDNIRKGEKQRKQRLKRENQKQMQADQAKQISEQQWIQSTKLDLYTSKMCSHFTKCQKKRALYKEQQGQEQRRKQKAKERLFVQLPKFQQQQSRAQQFRSRQIGYMFEEVERVQRRWDKCWGVAKEAVEGLVHIAVEFYQQFKNGQGFTYEEWGQVEKRFLEYQSPKKSKKSIQLIMDLSEYDQALKQYYRNQGIWKIYGDSSENKKEIRNEPLTAFISEIINKVYPDKQIENNSNTPLYMPLKLVCYGPRLSGKSTLAAKLSEKYGLLLINPLEVMKQAIELARPPVQEQPKKGGKKDPKKVQQPSPQKLFLKSLGQTNLSHLSSISESTREDLVMTLKLYLSNYFPSKTPAQILQDYTLAKTKEQQRYEQKVKEFEQGLKKPKKDKKGVENLGDPKPEINQFCYTQGFVIDGVDLDLQTVKLIEKQLNCYLTYEQRINPQAIKTREQIRLVLPIDQPPRDPSLKSGTFDEFVCFDVPLEKLQQRKNGRKIDPITKNVYHPVFNPPPEIKGFAQKLQELPIVQSQVLAQSVEKFNQQKDKIRQFYADFGIESKKIPAFHIVQEGEKSVKDTFEEIQKRIQELLLAKYETLEEQLSKQEQLNKQEEIKKQEELNKQLSEQKQQNAQQNQPLEQNQENTPAQPDESQNPLEEPQPQHPTPQTNPPSQTPSPASPCSPLSLSLPTPSPLLSTFLSSSSTYTQSLKKNLHLLHKQRHNFFALLEREQEHFVDVVNQPDDKAGKVLEFQENYNNLVGEHGAVVKDVDASARLQQKLKALSQSLWKTLQSKKDRAAEMRQNFMNSGWICQQSNKIVQRAKEFLQVQMNYICQIAFLAIQYACHTQGIKIDFEVQYLWLGIAPQMEPIPSMSNDPNDLTTNKRLQFYLDQTNKCLDSLPEWISQKQRKLKIPKLPETQILFKSLVQFSRAHITQKIQTIRRKVSERILQQRSFYQALLNKMDEWIIQGIKSENDFIYSIEKSIRNCILEAKPLSIRDFHPQAITINYPPINTLPLHPPPLTSKPSIYSLNIFLIEIGTLANLQGQIDFNIFSKYLEKRRRSKLLAEEILKIDINVIQQYLVKDNLLSYKELALGVILSSVKVLDEDSLSIYHKKLGEEEQTLKLNQFTLMETNFNPEQQNIMKHFVFEVFRKQNSDSMDLNDYIQTLRVFDQLQLQKYGDAVQTLII